MSVTCTGSGAIKSSTEYAIDSVGIQIVPFDGFSGAVLLCTIDSFGRLFSPVMFPSAAVMRVPRPLYCLRRLAAAFLLSVIKLPCVLTVDCKPASDVLIAAISYGFPPNSS